MVKLKREHLKKDVYSEELIRIDYLCSNDFKSELNKLSELFSQLRIH